MDDERYDYDYDNLPDRLALKKLMSNNKTYLKKCVKCGKEKLMQSNQLICSECTAKGKKEAYLHTHCSICSRHTRRLTKIGELRYCDICLSNKNSEIVKPIENPITHCKNPECNARIHTSTYVKNNGLCKECVENDKISRGVV